MSRLTKTFTKEFTKRLIAVLKILIVLAVCVWVVWELYKSWNKIHEIRWQPNYYYLVLSGVFYGVAFVPAALFWRFAMRKFGQSPAWYESFRAYYIGHLGKYVPGKAMAVVIRSGLLDHAKTNPIVAGAAVFLESLTMMSVGAFVAAVIVVVWFRNNIEHGFWLSLIAGGIVLVTALPVFPPVFRFAVSKVMPKEYLAVLRIRFKTLAYGWIGMIPVWIFLGLSLWTTVRGIGIETEPLFEVLPRFVLAAAFANVLGFAAMVPAGLGVRDFVMARVLTIYFAAHPNGADPALQAIVVAGLQRMISIMTELCIAAILCRSFRKKTIAEFKEMKQMPE